MSLSAIVTYVPFARGCDSVGYLCDFSFFSSDTVYKCKADGEEFDRTEVVYSDHHITLIQIGWKPSLWKVKPWHTSTSTLRRVDFLFRVGPPSTRHRPHVSVLKPSFSKTLFKPEELKTPAFRFRVDGNHFGNRRRFFDFESITLKEYCHRSFVVNSLILCWNLYLVP